MYSDMGQIVSYQRPHRTNQLRIARRNMGKAQMGFRMRLSWLRSLSLALLGFNRHKRMAVRMIVFWVAAGLACSREWRFAAIAVAYDFLGQPFGKPRGDPISRRIAKNVLDQPDQSVVTIHQLCSIDSTYLVQRHPPSSPYRCTGTTAL
jgi:hypothetical protein